MTMLLTSPVPDAATVFDRIHLKLLFATQTLRTAHVCVSGSRSIALRPTCSIWLWRITTLVAYEAVMP